jgi:CHAD domain-containing protein
MAYRVKRKERVGKAARRIVREQLARAIAVARDRQAPQDERVHEVRARLKRSCAALTLVRDGAGARAKRDCKRLRGAARPLARPRDLAISAQVFRSIGVALAPCGLPPRLLARVAAAEQQFRRALRPDDVEKQLRRTARALRRLRRQVGDWDVRRGRRTVCKGVTRAYRRGLAALAVARERPTPRRLHAWRKQVKTLAYELRLVAPAVPELTTTLMPKVDRLGDLLGQVHDLDVVRGRAERHPRWFGRTKDAEAVLAALDERRAELEAEAMALAFTVFAGRPRDVRALIDMGWRLWRARPAMVMDLPPAPPRLVPPATASARGA